MKENNQEINEEKKTSAGKIQWRRHEIILVTATAIIALAGYLWDVFHTSANDYAAPFINSRTPFNLFKNVLLPDIGNGLLAYAAYLWINLYSLPRFLFPKKVVAGMSRVSVSFSKVSFGGIAKQISKEYAWLFIQLILIIFVLGTLDTAAIYYRHQWMFNYKGFSVFFNPHNPGSQLNIGQGYFNIISILALYGLYVFVREFFIQLIQSSKQKEYNILVCNKVTSFIVPLVCLPVFLQSFSIIHEQQFFVSYYLVIPALFAMFISNVYWLFPIKGNDTFFSRKIMMRLISTSFVYAMPLVVFVHEETPIAFLYSWAAQLFIVTPLTWLYYQTNKEKIIQLRIVETALVKSKADIQFLRSQINPHFLFNVLNTLYGTALQEGAERTSEGIQKLGDMMRFMLHENNQDFIQMNKEIDYLKNYIALQKLRTQSSLGIIIEDNLNEQSCHHNIAPMLLIPLVENAFKHGISLQENSWIRITLVCTDESIRFDVRNSVHQKGGSDPEKERSGIGFKNVMERLKLIYPGRFQLSVNKDDTEFFVQLSIQP